MSGDPSSLTRKDHSNGKAEDSITEHSLSQAKRATDQGPKHQEGPDAVEAQALAGPQPRGRGCHDYWWTPLDRAVDIPVPWPIDLS
jgi:hypothetical protein